MLHYPSIVLKAIAHAYIDRGCWFYTYLCYLSCTSSTNPLSPEGLLTSHYIVCPKCSSSTALFTYNSMSLFYPLVVHVTFTTRPIVNTRLQNLCVISGIKITNTSFLDSPDWLSWLSSSHPPTIFPLLLLLNMKCVLRSINMLRDSSISLHCSSPLALPYYRVIIFEYI